MPPLSQVASLMVAGTYIRGLFVELMATNPTVNNMSVIHPTPDERIRNFERHWEICYDSFHEGVNDERAELYSEACKRLSLSIECEFTEFLQHEINFMKSLEDPLLLLRFVRMVEVDTLMLDRFGVVALRVLKPRPLVSRYHRKSPYS